MFPKVKIPKKTIYLDCAATTQLHPKVLKAMQPFLSAAFGNPSSLHRKGIEARFAVEDSRKTIARLINARPKEIVFTAGGTESVNLAIFGVARFSWLKRSGTNIAARRNGRLVKQAASRPHLITTAVEHHSVLNSFMALKEEGFKISIVGVDREGFVKLDDLKKVIRPETVLISVMHANNEVGTIQPISEIGRLLRAINASRIKDKRSRIIFHTDACQAAGSLNLNVEKLGVDLMSLNASKIYGPKQIGLLYVKTGTNIRPLIYGGGQEGGYRSGTENVAGIVGFAKALELSQGVLLKENGRLARLSKAVYLNLKKTIRDVELNGPKLESSNITYQKRLPNNLNLMIKEVEGEALMLYLDAYNIAVSTGSACTTGEVEEASHVLRAIGRTAKEAKSSVRITLTNFITEREINYFLKVLPRVVSELRKTKPN